MEPYKITSEAVTSNLMVITTGSLLDTENAPEMIAMITDAKSSGFTNVIVDMGQLEFIASAGVGSILGMVETFRESGGDIILCNVSGTIRHIFGVLDLEDYLTLKDTRAEAFLACGVEVDA